MCPLDTVLWLARDGSDGAERDGRPRGVDLELALDASRHGGEDDPRLALEAFGAAVDERLERVRVVHVNHVAQLGVYPPAGLDAVQPADDKLELHIEVVVKLLDAAVMRRDLNVLYPLLDKAGGDFCLVLSNIILAEQKLPVQVGNIYGICRWLRKCQVTSNRIGDIPVSLKIQAGIFL